jgi:iron complex transport system ATP-binding protein
MPQNINTDFPFCVEDFIMFGRYPYMNILKIPSQADFDAVWRVIDFMQIGDFCKRNINELSGGEKQKVLIAQTIVQGADILIFDEPTAHLDIGAQYSILEFLKELNEKSHKTIIAALHDLNAAGEFCENIILMDEGKIKASGAPNEVLDYKNIEDAYKTLVCTKENPISGKPYIIPVRKQQR